jgi:hypothetical protein
MSSHGEKFGSQAGVRWILDHAAEVSHHEERVHYQTLLRGLGAWLDDHPAQSFSVVETHTGFTMVSRRDGDPSQLDSITFAHLLDLAGNLKRKSAQPGGKYQNMLRALGYELDQLLASYILLDDVEDGLLLTYMVRPPDGNLMWRKQHVLLDTNDRSNLLKKAIARRAQVEQGRWGLKRNRKR